MTQLIASSIDVLEVPLNPMVLKAGVFHRGGYRSRRHPEERGFRMMDRMLWLQSAPAHGV
jgi:hypothetical protein